MVLISCLDEQYYSAFQIDEPHRHNQNPVGTFHGTSLLWSTDMKTAVIIREESGRGAVGLATQEEKEKVFLSQDLRFPNPETGFFCQCLLLKTTIILKTRFLCVLFVV